MPKTFRSSGNLLSDRRFAWAEAALGADDFAGAADLAEQVLELSAGYVPALAALGVARMRQGDVGEARRAFSEVLRLDPQDELGVAMHLARLGGAQPVGQGEVMSAAYVRALFDDYAERFEDHLTRELGYCGPELIMAALAALPQRPARFARVVDLGCGTGLMGAAIRARADELVGCDLSPAMVQRARARGLYDRLLAVDATACLDQLPAASCDLVLAADVLVYIGDPAALFAASARALRSGGLLAVTAQSPRAAQDGSVLGDDMRFAHGTAYLCDRLAAAGFAVRRLDVASARRDRGEPVPGLVLVAQRTEMDLPGAGPD